MAEDRIKIDMSKLPTAKEYTAQLEGTWLPFLTALDTSFDEMGNQIHKYVSQHTGEIGKEIAKGINASVTQAISMALGNSMPDISKFTKNDIAFLESKRNKTEQEKFIVNLYNASKRGTAVHKLMEEQEARGVTVGELQTLLKERKFDAQTMEIFDDFFSKDSIRAAQQFKNLFDTVGQILQIKEASGLKNTKFSETALGATTIINGKRVNITGTIDQIIDNALNDFKTGGKTGIKEMLQQTIYLALGQINKNLIPGVGDVTESYLTHAPKKGSSQLLRLSGVTPEISQKIMDAIALSVATGSRSNVDFSKMGLSLEPVLTRAKVGYKEFYTGTQYTTNQAFNPEMRDYEGMFWEKYGKEIQNIIDLPEAERTVEQIERINVLFGQFADTVNRLKMSSGQRIASDWWETQMGTIAEIMKGDASAIGKLSLTPAVQKGGGIAINDKFISTYFKEWKGKSKSGQEEIRSNVQELIDMARADPNVASAVSEWLVNQMIQGLFDAEDWKTLFDENNLTAYLNEQLKAGQLSNAQMQFVNSLFGDRAALELGNAFQRRNKRYQQSPAGQRWKQRWNYEFGTEREYLDIPKEEVRRNVLNLRDFEEKDWWEAEAQWQDTLLERGAERKSLGYGDEPIQGAQAATKLADRFTRLVDFYQRINNIFSNLAERLNNELSEGEPKYTAEELARGYLANLPEPDAYSRYMRSRELYKGFVSTQKGKPIKEQIKWLYDQLDMYSVEESSIQKAMNDMRRINSTEDINSFLAEYARKMQYVGKPSSYIDPYKVSDLLAGGTTFGAREESDYFEKYDYQRILDASGRANLKNEIENAVQGEQIGELDFYIKKITEEASGLGATEKQLSKVIKWLTDIASISNEISQKAKLRVPLGLDEAIDAAVALENGASLDETSIGDAVKKGRYNFGGFAAMPKGKGTLALIERIKDIREDYEQYSDEMATLQQVQVEKTLEQQKQFNRRYLETVRGADTFLKELQKPIEDPWDSLGTPVPEYVGSEETIHVGEATINTDEANIEAQDTEVKNDDGTIQTEESVAQRNNVLVAPADGGHNGGRGGTDNYPDFNISGGLPKVQVASNVPMPDELRTKKPKMTVIGADTTAIAAIYENAAKRVYADYGPGGLKAWIESHKDTDIESTSKELEDILSKVPSYVKNSGALSKAGTMRKDEIMKMIFGDSYQPNSGDNALLEEVKGIHGDTTEIKNAFSSGVIGDVKQNSLAQKVEDAFKDVDNDSNDKDKRTTKESEEQRNDRMRTYIELIKEEYSLLDKVAQLKQEMYAAQQRNEDTSGIQSQIDELNAVKDSVIKEQEVVEEGGFSDKQLARIAAERDVQEQKYRYKAAQYGYNVDTGESRLTVQDQMDNEKQYQTLLSQRLNIQKQILAAEHTIATSYSDKEKNALQEVISILNEKLLLNKEETDNLLTNNNLRKKEQEAIERNYNLELLQVKAQEASKKQGVTNIWDIMANDIKRATMRVIDFGLASKLLNSIPRSITQVAQTITQLEKAMTNLRVVADLNREEAENLMLTYNKLGKQLGATTQEIAEAANDWLRQGYDVAEVNKLIESSTQLAKLGMISQSEATTALTSALKGFKLEASEAASVVDKLTKVDQVAAVSAGGIATALSKSAVSANLAGMSMDELIAAVSTIGEVTQKSMDSVGEAMKTLLARYGNVKASVFTQIGLDDGGETTDNINDIEKVLRTLGIRVRSSSSEMRSITDVLDELASKWDTLDTVTKNAVSTAFGGTRMRENFLVLMENYSKYQELTEESVKSTGTAEEKYNHYLDSLEASTKRISNAWEEFSMKIESSWIMRTGASAIATITENLGSLLQVILAIAGAGIANKIRSVGGLGQIFGGASNQTKSFFAGFGRHSTYKFDAQGNLIQDKAAPTLTETLNGNGPDSYLGKLVASIDQKVGAIAAKEGMDVGSATGEEAQSISLRSIKEIRAAKKEVKELSSKDLDETGSMRLSNLKQALAAEKKVRLGNAAVSGALAGVVSAMSKTEVGGGLFGTLTGNTQTQEATAGDKVVQGMTTAVTTGLVSAIPGIGPLIGPILGPILGDTFGSLITSVFHIEELERKQRVEEAKKQLEALNNIESTIETGDAIMSEAILNADDYKKLEEYADKVADSLYDYISEFGTDIIDEIASNMGEFGGGIKTISDICNIIRQGNVEERELLQRQLEITQERIRLEALVASQEEERAEIASNAQSVTTLGIEKYGGFSSYGKYGIEGNEHQSISSETRKTIDALQKQGLIEMGYGDRGVYGNVWSLGVLGDNAKEQLENINKTISELTMAEAPTILVNNLEKLKNKIEDVVSANERLDKEIIGARANIGFLAADIYDLSDNELRDLTMDGVVGRVVTALENEGYAVRDLAGNIKDEYLSQVKALIKADSRFNTLLKDDTRTYQQLRNSQEKFNIIQKEGIEGLIDTNKSWKEWKLLASQGKLSEEIAKIVYAADPDRIQTFANAWHTTVENLDELTSKYPNLTTAIGLMSPSEVREYYSSYSTLFEDIISDAALTAENYEKLVSDYPQLVKYMKQGSDVLRSELFKSFGEEQRVAYVNALYSQEMSSTGWGTEFLKQIKTSIESGSSYAGVSSNILKDLFYDEKYLGNVKTLNDAIERANILEQSTNDVERERGKLIRQMVEEYMNFDQEIEWTNQLYEAALEQEKKNLDDRIDALNDQKDALDQVNDERQREIDLIKAREALENARKEKKRVYRAGVGWTYEADEEAISSAQETLDNLNIDLQKENLEYQIKQYELQKEILDRLDEAKEEKEGQKLLSDYLSSAGYSSGDVTAFLANKYGSSNIKYNAATGKFTDANGKEFDASGLPNEMQNFIARRENAQNELFGDNGAVQEFKKAKEILDNTKKGSAEWNDVVGAYNAAYDRLDSAITAGKDVLSDSEDYRKASGLLSGESKKDTILTGTFSNPNGTYFDKQTHTVWLDPLAEDFANAGGKNEWLTDNQAAGELYVAKYIGNGQWDDWVQYPSGSLASLPDFTIVANSRYGDEYAFMHNGVAKVLHNEKGENVAYDGGKATAWKNQWAQGTLSAQSGLSLINELGTEGIITPSGTLTALPAKSGVVPADITRNVWQLGEVAPTLIAQLGSLVNQKAFTGTPQSVVNEEGQYIDNLTMNVYPTKDYDMDALLAEARAKVRLTRHNN